MSDSAYPFISRSVPPGPHATFSIGASDVSVTYSKPLLSGLDLVGLRKPVKESVDEIRRLRGHHETTVFERCTRYFGHPTPSEYTTLTTLCQKLIEVVSSGSTIIRDYTWDQLLSLAFEDSLIRAILAIHYHAAESAEIDRWELKSFRFRMAISNSSTDIRGLWSNLLARCNSSQSLGPSTDVSGYVQSRRGLLKNSLSDPDLSFLAARYLCHVLKAQVVGNDLFYVAIIWHHYTAVATTNRDAIEWSNFDECIKTIYSSGKPFIAFVSPTRLGRLADTLIYEASDLPKLFSTIFEFPRIDFEICDSNVDGELGERFIYTHVGSRNFDILPSFVADFGRVPSSVRNTVFVSIKWIEYCRIVNNVFKSYSIGCPASTLSIARHSAEADPLYYEYGESAANRALAVFLLARFIGIDRYCKRIESERNDGLVPISLILVNNARKLLGPSKGTTIPQFDNVPYLRRFRVNGRFYITSDYLPELPNVLIASSLDNTLRNFSVDSMVIDGNAVLWLRFDSISPFDATGHYPILAGYDRDQRGDDPALYVAAVKDEFGYHFTCVQDGARTARYTDENGNTRGADVFFVLALRHDPAYDLVPPYPRIPGGAMDPTGPLYWLKFWPRKDADYCAASDSAKSDDGHLVSILDGYSTYGTGGADEGYDYEWFNYNRDESTLSEIRN